MMNERFHAFLHGCTRRRNKFVIVNFNCTGGHFIQALRKEVSDTPSNVILAAARYHLIDNSQGLSEFLHSTEITIVAIAIFAYWDIEFDLFGTVAYD